MHVGASRSFADLRWVRLGSFFWANRRFQGRERGFLGSFRLRQESLGKEDVML